MSPDHHTPDGSARSLPSASEVYDHIGRLLRELTLARRLYRLAKAAEEQRAAGRPVVGRG